MLTAANVAASATGTDSPNRAIRRLLHGKHPPGWCRL